MQKEGRALTFDEIRKIAETEGASVHFIGIGGVSMYSLANLTILSGAAVTGSDLVESERTQRLRESGAKIDIGHNGRLVESASLVVHSHAIPDRNPEYITAKNLGIPIVSRAEYMGALMIKYKSKIGVSGSHGKSTTVAMLDAIFQEAARAPSVLSGAKLPDGEPYRIGGDDVLLYEACEYRDSFLKFSPDVVVALNIELDHTDYFPDIEALKKSFTRAIERASKFAVINGDDEHLRRIARTAKQKIISFGQGERSTYRYRVNGFFDNGFAFEVRRGSEFIGSFRLNIPGIFNLSNATAAIVTALECGIDAETAKMAIAKYRGITDRMELVGDRFGRPIYHDYAHHPTEIAATVNAVRMQTHEPVTVVFKPHTYSRTKSLWEDFRMALSLADYVILTDIYPAREEPIAGVDSKRLADDIGDSAIFSEDAFVPLVVDNSTRGAIIIMGAGGLEEIKAGMKT